MVQTTDFVHLTDKTRMKKTTEVSTLCAAVNDINYLPILCIFKFVVLSFSEIALAGYLEDKC